MKKILFILLFIPFSGFSQLENIPPVVTTDTLSESMISTDSTVVITTKVLYKQTYYKAFINQRIQELRQDSLRYKEDRVWWLNNWNDEMTRINREKKRLRKFLNN